MLSKTNQGIREAYSELEIINNDEVKRQMYLRRQIALMDFETQKDSYYEDGKIEGKIEGRTEGRYEEKLALAKNLLDILDIETISIKTGLSIEQVKGISQ